MGAGAMGFEPRPMGARPPGILIGILDVLGNDDDGKGREPMREREDLDPRPYEPSVPARWVPVRVWTNPLQLAWKDQRRNLAVIFSAAVERDGRVWLHLSLSHRGRMPHWSEIVEAKEAFLGAEARALQVFPARSEWVNIHPFCLHLWRCLDDDGIPDFRESEPMLGGRMGI